MKNLYTVLQRMLYFGTVGIEWKTKKEKEKKEKNFNPLPMYHGYIVYNMKPCY